MCFTAVLCQSSADSSGRSNAASPVPGLSWRRDLREVGYEKEPWSRSYVRFLDADPTYDSVAFLDETVLLVAWAKREGAPLGSRRLRVALLDSSTGQILGTKDWSLPLRRMGLRASKGMFVLRDSNVLISYSPELNAVHRFPLTLSRKPSEEWRVYATPDQARLGLFHSVEQSSELYWLDGSTLSILKSWTKPKDVIGSESETDSTLAFSKNSVIWTKRLRGKNGCQIFLLGESASRLVAKVEDSCFASAQFLSEEILITPDPRHWTLRRTSGELIHQEELGRGEHAWSSRVSSDGRRAAVPIGRQRGGARFLDIYPQEELERIMVYDFLEGTWIFALDKKHANLGHVAGFALSPSGEALAILRDTAIEVYKLPPTR